MNIYITHPNSIGFFNFYCDISNNFMVIIAKHPSFKCIYKDTLINNHISYKIKIVPYNFQEKNVSLYNAVVLVAK